MYYLNLGLIVAVLSEIVPPAKSSSVFMLLVLSLLCTNWKRGRKRGYMKPSRPAVLLRVK